jgi:hypothetical protein
LALAPSQTEADQQAYVKELHLLKTALFSDMIRAGLMPLRPGVARLVRPSSTHTPPPIVILILSHKII